MARRTQSSAPEDCFETAADLVAGLTTFARVLARCGWEVNLSVETGAVERMNFSAQRRPDPCL